MRHWLLKIIALALFPLINSCGVYNFTGMEQINAKTYQVNYFQNTSELVEPGLDRDFTIALQELIQNQTNLNMVNADGELVYEGEIVDFRISPMTATADQRTAQNRVTISVLVKFVNNNNEKDNFERRFSHFYDYPATQQLIGATLQNAKQEIFERITQDIFNASLAKW